MKGADRPKILTPMYMSDLGRGRDFKRPSLLVRDMHRLTVLEGHNRYYVSTEEEGGGYKLSQFSGQYYI